MRPEVQIPLAGEDVGAESRQVRVGDLFREDDDDRFTANVRATPGDPAVCIEHRLNS